MNTGRAKTTRRRGGHQAGFALIVTLLLLALLFLRHGLQLNVDFVERNVGGVGAAVPPLGQGNPF